MILLSCNGKGFIMIKVDCVSRVAKAMLKNSKVPATSKLGLPAKVALGSLAALSADTLFMSSRSSCDDYEPIDYCSPLFP